jgi:hypothetical protein
MCRPRKAVKARRPIVVMNGVSGFTAGLVGQCIDGRGGAGMQPVLEADTAQQAVQLLGL